VSDFIYKIYSYILHFLGFQQGEHITDMLKRQKQRLGVWWWLLPGATFGGLTWLLFHVAC